MVALTGEYLRLFVLSRISPSIAFFAGPAKDPAEQDAMLVPWDVSGTRPLGPEPA
jgi:hypothetical protein